MMGNIKGGFEMKQANYRFISESDRDIIYPIYENSDICPKVIEVLGEEIREIVKKEFNQVTKVYTLGKYPFKSITFIGLGDSSKITTAKMREAFATVSKCVETPSSFDAKRVVTCEIDVERVAQLFVETYLLTTYEEVKVGKEGKIVPDVSIIAPDVDLSSALEEAVHYAMGINQARDLGNCPANIMTPKKLVEVAMNLAKQYDLECTILDKEGLVKLGAGGILAVNQGSDEEPYMICLKYTGANEEDPYTALIGKGLTFDSGGYNIKGNSYGMKYDMCGGADVLGAMSIIVANKMSANVYCIVPATENLINGSAYKPEDVITTLSKQTVEIVSTDAEGRLILCDAITYAQMLGAKRLVDIATLTGACMSALGGIYTGVFTNSDKFYQTFKKSMTISDEKGWLLPIGQEYLDMLKSDSADFKNSAGKPGGGASVAASFLEAFVNEDVEWIHLDVAGIAHKQGKGATGEMVRSLVNIFKI